jgi:hypothetical protein
MKPASSAAAEPVAPVDRLCSLTAIVFLPCEIYSLFPPKAIEADIDHAMPASVLSYRSSSGAATKARPRSRGSTVLWVETTSARFSIERATRVSAKSRVATSATAARDHHDHGSPHDFAAPSLDKAGGTTDPGQLGHAVYFSTDPNVAASSPFKYQANLAIENPLRLEKTDWTQVTSALGIPADSSPAEITAAAQSRGF